MVWRKFTPHTPKKPKRAVCRQRSHRHTGFFRLTREWLTSMICLRVTKLDLPQFRFFYLLKISAACMNRFIRFSRKKKTRNEAEFYETLPFNRLLNEEISNASGKIQTCHPKPVIKLEL